MKSTTKTEVNMPKIKSKTSTVISQVLTCILIAAMVLATCTMPFIVNWYIRVSGREGINAVFVIIVMYVALIPAYAAVISLWKLLAAVKREDIFTPASVSQLRLISYCAFAEAVVFAILSNQFLFSLAISFAGVFIGMVIRVVKNVIQTAVEVKEENDYTI